MRTNEVINGNANNHVEYLVNMRRRAGEIRHILAAGAAPHLLTESADSTPVVNSMVGAAMKTPLFADLNIDPRFLRPIMASWSRAYRGFIDTHRYHPSDDVLANAHQSLQNLLRGSLRSRLNGAERLSFDDLITEGVGDKDKTGRAINDAFFESALGAPEMSQSEGVKRIALYASLVLPVQLGAETSVLASQVPCPNSDENKFYRMSNVASSNFGSYKQGDELHMQSAGYYSQMMRIHLLPAAKQPDGKKKSFTFLTSDVETGAYPVRAGRVRIQINRECGDYDDGNGRVSWSGEVEGDKIECTGLVDYLNGKIDLTFASAPKASIEISFLMELDVEKKPSMIPLVNQVMAVRTVKPSQYVIATEHTIQSLTDAQREFGLDLGGMSNNLLTQFLSHEADITRLRLASFYARDGGMFDMSYPANGDWREWAVLFAGHIHQLSSDMSSLTRSTGVKGMFAGADVVKVLVTLTGKGFEPITSPLKISPYVQYIGRAFGLYDVYSVPEAITRQFESDPDCPIEFSRRDVLFYGRGDGLMDAPLIGGDAIPAMPFQHPTNPALVNRISVYGQAVNCINPDDGADYIVKCRLTSVNKGFIDPFDGGINA